MVKRRAVMSACPSEARLVAYATGETPAADRAGIEAHMAECAECRAIVSMLAKDPAVTTDPLAATALAPTPSPTLTFAPGEIFEEKYRVERLLGAGGMGFVVEATHLGLDRKVAIKFMRRETREVPEAAVRFLREARACANLTSHHVVRVFDNGISRTGEPYLVMELLRGEDLAHVLKREKRIAPAQAAAWVLEACDAVAEAHRAGIVHRDLKPANLFLAENAASERQIKVLDFGVSKLLGESAVSALTSRSAFVGSPRYMSPEQTQSNAHIDSRTDIWALGIVLYELTSGTTPFEATNPVGLAAAILTQDVPPLRARCPDVPAAFEKIVMRCLAKKPDDRYASIESLVEALRSMSSIAPRSALSSRAAMAIGALALVAGALVVSLGAWQWHRASAARGSIAATTTATAVPTETTAALSMSSFASSPSALASPSPSQAPTSSASSTASSRHAMPHVAPAARSARAAPSSASSASTSTSIPPDLPGMSDRK